MSFSCSWRSRACRSDAAGGEGRIVLTLLEVKGVSFSRSWRSRACRSHAHGGQGCVRSQRIKGQFDSIQFFKNFEYPTGCNFVVIMAGS